MSLNGPIWFITGAVNEFEWAHLFFITGAANNSEWAHYFHRRCFQ